MKSFFKLLLPAIAAGMLWLSPAQSSADALGPLRFITENYAPYNFLDEGSVKGTSVDLLLEIFEAAKTERTEEDIEVMNWARGYQLAQTEPNTVLFSTTRTAIREDLFKWIGPISPTRIVILAKKDRQISLDTVESLTDFRTGAVRDDIGELLILNAGLPQQNVYRTNSAETTAKMLIADRIDLWAYEESVAFHNLAAQGEDPNDYEVVLELEQSFLYFAIQRDTNPTLIQALEKAYQKAVSQEQ